ncbi:MAG: MFS transporter [Deltaproteobacteria bacterium]|nr:MFS transporter [Deltaproteobacteria bacterium]
MPSGSTSWRRVVDVRPEETGPLVWSFGFFFCVLASYYLVRPLREEMAIQYGAARVQHLLTATFVAMLVLVPLFGWLVKRLPPQRLLPAVYLGCAVVMLGFFAALQSGVARVVLAPAFFVFVSVFNLFAVSVFWSFMADLFASDAAKRLFGFISAGGSLGAIVGPAGAATLVPWLGANTLLLAAAGVLLLSLLCITRLVPHLPPKRGRLAPPRVRLMEGIVRIARSRYLAAVCVFLVCYTLLGTFLYFQQLSLVKAAIASSAERTRLFAKLDLLVNVVSLVAQLTLTGKVLPKWGLTASLVALPLVSVVGFAGLGWHTTLTVLVVFGAVRRVGEFAVSKPSREALFTVVSSEDKYQAKNVIDTLVHRGGDALSGWVATGLTGAGLSLSGLAFVGVPVAFLWAGTALYLGRQHERLAEAAPRR